MKKSFVLLIGFSALLSACKGVQETFPPEGVDHLAMTVTVAFEVFAIGKDTVDLTGTVAVHRSGPQGTDGKTMVGELVGAAMRGKSKVFGEVIAMQSPIQRSPCEYTYKGPGNYEGYFDINGWFWLPEHDLLVFSGEPVRVKGTATMIPPVGEKAVNIKKDIALLDFRRPSEKPIGVLTEARGEIHEIVPLEKHRKRPETTVPALAKTK